MMKNYGVCLCLVALGLVGIGAPNSRAARRAEAGGAAAVSEAAASAASTTSTASAATESNAADLRQRIEALKAELSDLNTQLAATETATIPADGPSQDQGAAAAPAQAPAAGAAPAATTPPAPMPLSSPSMSGPLATSVPHEISAGPFGKLEVTGILSGIGLAEDNHVLPGSQMHADVSNAQVFVQKTTGWFQFYLQGGAYNIPALATPFTQDGPTITGLYGPFPQGYAKLVKGNFNIEIGALPTLIGAEYTFDFENMNIERGLLWNQENAVNRGIQLNETYKKATIALSWNDGFYSNHYNWLTGSLAWAFNSANTLSFVGGGPFSANGRSTTATPGLQNNSMIFNLIYTYTHGNWIISPYYQYTAVKENTSIGITTGSHTNGGALLLDYAFKHGFSMALRPEYIKSSTGNVLDQSSNLLLLGPGTGGFSFTATPTYIKDGFFLRGDISVVHVTNFNTTSGFAFGTDGTKLNQIRGVIETGFMF